MQVAKVVNLADRLPYDRATSIIQMDRTERKVEIAAVKQDIARLQAYLAQLESID